MTKTMFSVENMVLVAQRIRVPAGLGGGGGERGGGGGVVWGENWHPKSIIRVVLY
jgi:hypothetical protein